MRHKRQYRRLHRTSEHRLAMHRNLAQSLIEHGSIRTTMPKAKDLQPIAEKILTLAITAATGSSDSVKLSARRRLHQMLGDRAIIAAEHRDAYEDLSSSRRAMTLANRSGRRYRTGAARGKLEFTAESVVHRLINTVAPKVASRKGGHTRIVRLPNRRVGDHTALAILQFVGDEASPGSLPKPRKTDRQKRIDARYAFTAKVAKSSARSARAGQTEAGAAPAAAAE